MPLHQCRGVPHQHGQQVVEHEAAPQRDLKARLLHQLLRHFGGDGVVAQRQARQAAVVEQRGQADDQQNAQHVEQAQDGQRLDARLAAAKRRQDQAGAGDAVLRGLGGAQHHHQEHGGHQDQRQVGPDHRQHAQQGDGRHAEEQQGRQCHGLAPEGLHAKLDPLQAGAGGNDVEFHVCGAQEGATAGWAPGMRTTVPHGCGAAVRGADRAGLSVGRRCPGPRGRPRAGAARARSAWGRAAPAWRLRAAGRSPTGARSRSAARRPAAWR